MCTFRDKTNFMIVSECNLFVFDDSLNKKNIILRLIYLKKKSSKEHVTNTITIFISLLDKGEKKKLHIALLYRQKSGYQSRITFISLDGARQKEKIISFCGPTRDLSTCLLPNMLHLKLRWELKCHSVSAELRPLQKEGRDVSDDTVDNQRT